MGRMLCLVCVHVVGMQCGVSVAEQAVLNACQHYLAGNDRLLSTMMWKQKSSPTELLMLECAHMHIIRYCSVRGLLQPSRKV